MKFFYEGGMLRIKTKVSSVKIRIPCCDMDSLVVGWRVGPDEKGALREEYDEKKCSGAGKFNCIQTQRIYFGRPIS